MDVVRLGHAYIIRGKIVHDLGQIFVQGKEDVHAHTEVGGVEEGLALLFTFGFHLIQTIQPTGCSGYDRYIGFETLHVVVEGCGRCRKLNGDICTFKSLRMNLFRIVDIDDGNNLMSSFQGDLFDGLAHLAVANQCYSHI